MEWNSEFQNFNLALDPNATTVANPYNWDGIRVHFVGKTGGLDNMILEYQWSITAYKTLCTYAYHKDSHICINAYLEFRRGETKVNSQFNSAPPKIPLISLANLLGFSKGNNR